MLPLSNLRLMVDFTCFNFCAILLLLLTIVVLAGFYKQESIKTQAEESQVEEKKKECGQKRKAKSHYNDGTGVQILQSLDLPFETLANEALRHGLKECSWPTLPQLYIDGKCFDGCDITFVYLYAILFQEHDTFGASQDYKFHRLSLQSPYMVS